MHPVNEHCKESKPANEWESERDERMVDRVVIGQITRMVV